MRFLKTASTEGWYLQFTRGRFAFRVSASISKYFSLTSAIGTTPALSSASGKNCVHFSLFTTGQP
ncbi:hypothetical protein EB241_05670 [Erwinia psidii]|uniref:Uncharacterized protein n=1 Tax=Erwinia psidii TaxID=69224 RepID=A0A3N6TVF8_9GAMM|nr:hypothetical protein EB241_05670 [Erwinia psidii]